MPNSSAVRCATCWAPRSSTRAPATRSRLRLDGSHRDRIWLQVSTAAVIPADVQERMFVPGPSRAGREVPGFGLGLHHIDGFIRAHGGSVVGRSRNPDGTVFELLLPRDAIAAT